MAEVAQMELLPASLVAQQTPVRQSENRLCYAIFADTHITDQELEPIVQAVPNAVAAVHLARLGRGAAALSTSLNSNNFNVLGGLLVPGVAVGLSEPSISGTLTAGWYGGMTALVLALAYRGRGLGRSDGWIIIAGYAAFVTLLIVAT